MNEGDSCTGGLEAWDSARPGIVLFRKMMTDHYFVQEGKSYEAKEDEGRRMLLRNDVENRFLANGGDSGTPSGDVASLAGEDSWYDA